MVAVYKYGLYAAVATLFILIACVQMVSDRQKPSVPFIALQSLPAPVLSGAMLGLRSAAASLLWLQTIQYIGGTGGGLAGVGDSIERVVALDPKFSYPYAFAVLMLPSEGKEAAEQAIALGKAGIAQNLGDWRIPYYLAMTYHLTLKDTTNAALYMNIAANTPGVPEGIKLSAHNYGLRSDLREETKQIWVAIYENSADEVVRAQAQNNVEHISIMQLLDQAIAAYKKVQGTYPTNLDQLVKAGILPSIPTDPFGIRYGISPEGVLTYQL